MVWLLLSDLYIFIVFVYYTSCTGSFARDWPRRYNPKSGSEEKILGGLFTRKSAPEAIIESDHFSLYTTVSFTPPTISTIYSTIKQNITRHQDMDQDTSAVISIMAIAVAIFLGGLALGLKYHWSNRQAAMSSTSQELDEKPDN